MAQPALPRTDLEASLEALHEASFGWARSCCLGTPDEAADVLQTAYVKVLSGRAQFAGRSGFKTWFFGVIRLTAYEVRRKGAREVAPVAGLDPVDPQRPADAVLVAREEEAALRDALARLPERQQEVLHLVFYQGLSIAEAADVMTVSLGSARTHYDRGKKRLRALLMSTSDGGLPAASLRDSPLRRDPGQDPGQDPGHKGVAP
ncbi:MAG: RNA polymerase sigma factor [Gemmatimonadaceae bacterium]|nr:RNA polymerase sigma factor [Gemmatimonadaceae bacterium]